MQLEPMIVMLAGWASGISVYLTVGLLGVCGRFGWIALPGNMEIFSNPLVFVFAFLLFAVEFVADKVPFVDSMWDSIHTFIRPAGGLAMGYLAGSAHGPLIQTLYALLAGTMTLTMHTAKATGRLAINTSPEPFSNIAASTTEQGSVFFMFWFFIKHPLMASLLMAAICVAAFFLIRLLWRFAKKIFSPKSASSVKGDLHAQK